MKVKKDVNKMRILLTPPDPRLYLFIVVVVALQMRVYGQSCVSFAEDEVVRLAINQKYDSLAERELYDESRIKRYRFLNFIPSPGYSVRQGATVGYNVSSVFGFLESKERYRIEKERIVNTYQEKADREFEEYVAMREKVETLRDDLEVQEQLLSLERKLFAISEAKYQNHEITPTQYIQEEITFRQKEWKYEKQQEKLMRQEGRLRQYYDKQRIYYADAN